MSASIRLIDFLGLERISRPSWYRLVRAGTAPRFYKVGASIRIDVADYERWRESRKLAVAS